MGKPPQLDEEVGEPSGPGICRKGAVVVKALGFAGLFAGSLRVLGQQPPCIRRVWPKLLQQTPLNTSLTATTFQLTAT